MTPPIIIISAMSQNHVIGHENGMPWDVPEEYHQYLNFVKGQTIVMGRRSFEIFGPDLRCETNLVISRSIEAGKNYEVFPNLPDAIERANKIGKKIFIAGGSSIYAQVLPFAHEMYLSFIKGDYEGDVYFPNFNSREWQVEKREDHARFEFAHYKRS